MIQSKRVTAVLAVALGAILALSSCAGGGAPTPTTTPPVVGVSDTNAQARDAVNDGGTLTWALSAAIPNFNFHNVNGAQVGTYNVLAALLPRPFLYSDTGEFSVNEDYFTSIEVTGESPFQVTYVVNEDAVWTDGTAISAADFEGMWRASSGNDSAYESWSNTGYNLISSVEEGSSAREIVVTFDSVFADWPTLFELLLPASATATPDAFNTGWASAPLVTSGPFVWGAEDKSAQTYTLNRNTEWWGNPAKLEAIQFKVYAEPAAALQSFRTNQLDFTEILPDREQYAAALELADVDVRSAGSAVFRRFTFNVEDPLMSDPVIRQAVILGVDRERIATLVVGEIGGSRDAMQNHIFVKTQEGYAEGCAQLCAYDPEAAKALLESDGWELGADGIFEKDGSPLEVAMTIQSGRTNSASEAQIAQTTLKEAGIRLVINTVPVNDFFTKYITVGNFQLATWTWTGSALPISQAISMYSLEDGELLQNYGRAGSEEINDLLNRAVQTTDAEAGRALANEADALLWQNAGFLPLYQQPQNTAVRSTVANLGAGGFASIRYEDIGFTD